MVARSDDIGATRLRRLATIEQTFQALAIDATVAREYGRLAAVVVGAGRKPRTRSLDLLIAATASANHARLFTRNPSDFAGLEDLLEIVSIR
jgi:toxin FitB